MIDKKPHKIGAAAIILAALCVTAVFIFGRLLDKEGSLVPLPKEMITGLSGQVDVKTVLTGINQTAQTLIVTRTPDDNFKIDIPLPDQVYRLSYVLEGAGNDIRDIKIDVNREALQGRIVMAGFAPRLPVSVSLDERIVEKNVPADWAGRIEFNLRLSERIIPLCLSWPSEIGPATLCHVIGRKEAA